MSFLLAFTLALAVGAPQEMTEDELGALERDFVQLLEASRDRAPSADELRALVDRALDVADSAADDATEYGALTWAMRIAHFRFPPDFKPNPELDQVYAECLDRTVTDYLDDPRLGDLVLSLEENGADGEALEVIRARSTEPAIRACLDWRRVDALMEMRRFAPLSPEQDRELRAGLEAVAGLHAEVADPFGRGTFGELAARALFELENLVVGAEAPDIVGEDIDGVEFRLSDYRGKVVLLDFWGHW